MSEHTDPDAYTPLSPAEQQEFERLCEIIKKGPRTPEAIGEPLWTVEHENLYRGVVGSMETFFPVVLGIDPEEGFKLIADWEAMTGHTSEAVHRGYSHHDLAVLRKAMSKLPGLTSPQKQKRPKNPKNTEAS